MERKIDRVVRGIVKSQRQEVRRAVDRSRMESNARDERRQYVVVPAMHISDQGKRP